MTYITTLRQEVRGKRHGRHVIVVRGVELNLVVRGVQLNQL